jgi:putative DeoR family transcriptional regulator (stage III sporulation protein D)
MKEDIYDRAINVALYIVSNKATVRQAAAQFGISKSTISKDMVKRLPTVSPKLAIKVKEVVDFNMAERHVRGGESTRKKFAHNTDRD